MGNFYHNVTFKNASQEALSSLFRDAGLTAYLSPQTNGAVVALFPMEEYEQTAESAPDVIARLGSPAIGVTVFDDDVVVFDVFSSRGHLFQLAIPVEVAESFAAPSELPLEIPSLEHATTICDLLLPSGSPARVLDILSKDYVFQFERHADLFDRLQLPDMAVAWGYEDVETDQFPSGITLDDLMHVP